MTLGRGKGGEKGKNDVSAVQMSGIFKGLLVTSTTQQSARNRSPRCNILKY